MTLLELLVKDLDRWPLNVTECSNYPKSDIYAWIDTGRGFARMEAVTRPSVTPPEHVTREQYEAALAASKQPEWIDWNGGRCPVEQGTLVDVQYRDGKILCRIPANKTHPGLRDAQAAFWRNEARENDIVAYRLSESEKWNGEGLPPVGTRCEWQDKNTKAWLTVVVVYSSEWVTVIKEDKEVDPVELAIENYADEERCKFRPIQTEAERKRDDVVDSIVEHYIGYHGDPKGGEAYIDRARAIYAAIAAGEINGIKLDH